VSAERLEGTRRRILDGARDAFATHGYDGATVKVLEEATGLSRGAIFHHFRDKDALFLALAQEDAEELGRTVTEHGLVGAMRLLPTRDAGWLGVQLEVSRRLRTDPAFRAAWRARTAAVRRATRDRLRSGQRAGAVRDDVPAEILASFLQLVHDGLVLHLAAGLPDRHAAAVLDLAEAAVRRPRPPRQDDRRRRQEQP
jgi:AcrR family transcriptional regulator